MIKVAICDDQEIILKKQQMLISEAFNVLEIKCEIEIFTSGAQLIESKNAYDLIFLDIDMPDLDGLSAASTLRSEEDEVLIIFVSSLKEKVFDTFKVRAFDFLVKPLSYNQIAEVIVNAVKEIKRQSEDYMLFDIHHGKQLSIPLQDLIYIETNQRGTKLHLRDSVYESPMKLSDLEKELSEKDFYKIYTSFLVNFRHVRDYCQTHVVTSHGSYLNMSRGKYGDFRTAYFKYLKRKI